jgi:hypothetical protein
MKRRAIRLEMIGIAAALLASAAGCVEERVISDNSVDAKMARSIKPGYVHQGGPTDFGPAPNIDFGPPAGATWTTNLNTDQPSPPPNK